MFRSLRSPASPAGRHSCSSSIPTIGYFARAPRTLAPRAGTTCRSSGEASLSMGRSLVDKLIDRHLVEGGSQPGDEIALRVDQVLLQDATGAMAFLCFEAMGLERVRPRIVVQYADHQTLQNDGRHSDDHQFLESACRKFGAYYGKPGVGICHVVHLEQFSVPGESALGSDSHTP